MIKYSRLVCLLIKNTIEAIIAFICLDNIAVYHLNVFAALGLFFLGSHPHINFYVFFTFFVGYNLFAFNAHIHGWFIYLFGLDSIAYIKLETW